MQQTHMKKFFVIILLCAMFNSTNALFDFSDAMFERDPEEECQEEPKRRNSERIILAGITAVVGASHVVSKVSNGINYAAGHYEFARRYLMNIGAGAKIGSLRLLSPFHWASTAIEPFAAIKGLGWLSGASFAIRRGPDLFSVLTSGGFDPIQKAVILALHLTHHRSFNNDSAGLQLSVKEIIEQSLKNGIFNRGDLNKDKWTRLRNSPEYQSSCNRLLYSLFSEIGINGLMVAGVRAGTLTADNALGRFGVDIAILVKELVLSLGLLQYHFGRTPEVGTYVSENVFRTALKVLISTLLFDRRGATDGVYVALRTCENDSLLERQIGFARGQFYEQLDAILDVVLGDASRHANTVMRGTRDLLYNVPGTYSPEFRQSLAGLSHIIETNELNQKLGGSGLFDHEFFRNIAKNMQPKNPAMALPSAAEEAFRLCEEERVKLAAGNTRMKNLLTRRRSPLLGILPGRTS